MGFPTESTEMFPEPNEIWERNCIDVSDINSWTTLDDNDLHKDISHEYDAVVQLFASADFDLHSGFRPSPWK